MRLRRIGDHEVFETQLPGVGRRYTLTFPSGGEFVVVLQNDGQRRTYWREESGAESEESFEATGSQARKIAEIFDGTYFDSVDEELNEALEDARIRWVEIDRTSSIANKTIRESHVRSRSGVSILAIQRGEQTISNPDPDTEIRAGDILVVVGTDGAHESFEKALTA